MLFQIERKRNSREELHFKKSFALELYEKVD